jgi:hypothetical protein
MKVPLKRGGNQGLRAKGGLFLHHPKYPGKFIQMPKTSRGGRSGGPVSFREELRLLEPGREVSISD